MTRCRPDRSASRSVERHPAARSPRLEVVVARGDLLRQDHHRVFSLQEDRAGQSGFKSAASGADCLCPRLLRVGTAGDLARTRSEDRLDPDGTIERLGPLELSTHRRIDPGDEHARVAQLGRES